MKEWLRLLWLWALTTVREWLRAADEEAQGAANSARRGDDWDS